MSDEQAIEIKERKTICLRYDHLLLQNILIRDEAELMQVVPNNINFNTKIRYRCKCGSLNIKTISAMFKLGCVCKKCILPIKMSKKEATSLERYGVKSTASLESNKIKRKETCMAKYGVDNASKCQEIKDKISQYMIKRHAAQRAALNPICENTKK